MKSPRWCWGIRPNRNYLEPPYQSHDNNPCRFCRWLRPSCSERRFYIRGGPETRSATLPHLFTPRPLAGCNPVTVLNARPVNIKARGGRGSGLPSPDLLIFNRYPEPISRPLAITGRRSRLIPRCPLTDNLSLIVASDGGIRDEKPPPIPALRIHPAESLNILVNLANICYCFIDIAAQEQDFQIVEIEHGEPW
jgi:hypothetical protein